MSDETEGKLEELEVNLRELAKLYNEMRLILRVLVIYIAASSVIFHLLIGGVI